MYNECDQSMKLLHLLADLILYVCPLILIGKLSPLYQYLNGENVVLLSSTCTYGRNNIKW